MLRGGRRWIGKLPPLIKLTLIYSLPNSAYWSLVTGMTLGIGDVTPSRKYVRLFCIFFIPFCVAVLGEFLARVASAYMQRKQKQKEEDFMGRSLTLCDLETMDTDLDGEVSKAEFLSYMLVALQKVEQDDIAQILALFDRLDKTHSNCLTKYDSRRKNWNAYFRKSLAHIHVPLATLEEIEEVVSDEENPDVFVGYPERPTGNGL